jgi:hypothetical protein
MHSVKLLDWARVVFVSSESAIFVPKEMVHYGFSKSAQLVIARGAAEMTKGTNVTVNSVLPGPTWVEMQSVRLGERAKAQGTTVEDLASRTFTERRPASLLQRYATPEEVANLICYVCSKASSATNGAALRADGGIVTNPFWSHHQIDAKPEGTAICRAAELPLSLAIGHDSSALRSGKSEFFGLGPASDIAKDLPVHGANDATSQ